MANGGVARKCNAAGVRKYLTGQPGWLMMTAGEKRNGGVA